MPRLLLALLLLTGLQLEAAERPPNVIVIVADDLGIYDLHCYGRADQATPAIDAFASEGVRFTSAYAAQPLGAATRAALLTGKSPSRLHLTSSQPPRADRTSQKLLQPETLMALPREEKILAQEFKTKGYATAFMGKWNLGDDDPNLEQRGFDRVLLSHGGKARDVAAGARSEEELTEQALKFIEEQKANPFYLQLSYELPHVSLLPVETPPTKLQVTFNPQYSTLVSKLDEAVQAVLQKLDQLGLTQQSLVLVTSDNGGSNLPTSGYPAATHNGLFRGGKGYLYEGGLRVPLIVRWPGKVKAGTVDSRPVALGGIRNTLGELEILPKAETADFPGFADSLLGKEPGAQPDLLWHMPHYTDQGGKPGGAIRSADWKLIEDYETGATELYNLATDSGELQELSMKEPAMAATLRGKLATWRLSVGAQENAANPAFDLPLYTEIYGRLDVSRPPPAKTTQLFSQPFTAWRQAMDRPASIDIKPTEAPGFLVLHAHDAVVHGDALRYESQPEKNTLGFWKYAADTASWKLSLPASGRYTVDALVGCGKGSGGARVEIGTSSSSISFQVAETGHFQNFVPQRVGTLRFSAGESTITVTPKSKPGFAVMDLRQLTLTKISD